VSAKEPTPRERLDLLQGTLDMLVLRTLVFGPRHGHEISTTIQQQSDDELLVDHGSLYPALQRLQRKGWTIAKWGVSENNRRAKYYSLTRAGRKQLVAETSKWERLARAVASILKPAGEGEAP
jgi:transcriptional regulator